MADVKWIKLATDVFDDEKILLIESLPEADSIIVIWFKLLCLAGKQNNGGVFMMGNAIPYTDSMLATIFRRKEMTVKLALETFERFGMVELIDNVITIPKWSKHQSLDSYEKKKERDRVYQAQRRSAQKAISEKSSDKSSDVAILEKNRIEENRIDKRESNTHAHEEVDFETIWQQTFNSYPKKSNYNSAKTEWMNIICSVVEPNRKEMATMIWKAMKAYLKDYKEKNTDDDNYRFVPAFNKWLTEELDYWLAEIQRRKESEE